jgi:hypothetical protein
MFDVKTVIEPWQMGVLLFAFGHLIFAVCGKFLQNFDGVLGKQCLVPICVTQTDRALMTGADANDTCDSPIGTENPCTLLDHNFDGIIPL